MNILWQVFYKVSAFVNSPEFLRSFFDNRFYLILLVIILMRFKYATYSSMRSEEHTSELQSHA